ncbi:hypothetical protein KDA_76170 [Dictyobacter alpinus]|uniref:Uncharacterized protein n=1 Tax=Dictyobacter alpinus TaxID=2014873 RepID=A0A402BL93_9CHLR|nr:hypothetical protein KDA_76170 [Dictyobacter alpinus]
MRSLSRAAGDISAMMEGRGTGFDALEETFPPQPGGNDTIDHS